MSYALCGLKVASDLPLPDLAPWSGDDRPADIEIRLGDVPDRLENPIFEGPLLHVGGGGVCRYVIAGVAAYLVEDGRRITVQPFMAPDAPDIRVFLLGGVFGFLCHQRGLLPLHASCVEIDGRAVAFAGPSGIGKSTLAAAFLRRGYRVPADDVTVVDVTAPGGPLVLPSFPRLKLWRDAMDGLGLSSDGLERSRAQLEKFNLPARSLFRTEPLPLAAVHHLGVVNDSDRAGLEPLRGVARVEALTQAIYRRMAALHMGRSAALMAAVMRVSSVPVRRLSRTSDFGALDAVIAMITDQHAAPIFDRHATADDDA